MKKLLLALFLIITHQNFGQTPYKSWCSECSDRVRTTTIALHLTKNSNSLDEQQPEETESQPSLDQTSA